MDLSNSLGGSKWRLGVEVPEAVSESSKVATLSRAAGTANETLWVCILSLNCLVCNIAIEVIIEPNSVCSKKAIIFGSVW